MATFIAVCAATLPAVAATQGNSAPGVGIWARDTVVAASPDQQLEVRVAKAVPVYETLCPGEAIIYFLELENQSDPRTGPMYGVLVDPVPANTTFVEGSLRGVGRFNAGANQYEWDGDLSPGEMITATFQVRVDDGVPNGTVIRNVASAALGELSVDAESETEIRCPTPTPTTTPSPTPSPTRDRLPDLSVSAVEINQAIQNIEHEAPLVQDKLGAARIYVRSDAYVVPNVSAELRGFRDGAELPGSPLRPANRVRARPTGLDAFERGSPRGSLNIFFLPPRWRQGQVTFRAEVNPDREIAESDYENNTREVTVTFRETPALRLILLRIRYDQDGEVLVPTLREFSRAQPFMLDVLPTHALMLYDAGEMTTSEDLSTRDGWSELLDEIWWRDVFSIDPGGVWFGLVHGRVRSPDVAGMAHYGGVAAGQVSRPDTLVHEIGHVAGRRHVNCPDGKPERPDPSYPYEPCAIADGSAEGYFGWSARQLFGTNPVHPFAAADVMSYEEPEWISDYTYRAIWEWLRGAFGSSTEAVSPRSPLRLDLGLDGHSRAGRTPLRGRGVGSRAWEPEQAVGHLALTGRIDPAEGGAQLGPIYRLAQPGVAATERPGSHALELMDSAGRVVHTHTFEPVPPQHGPADMLRFAEVMRDHADAHRLVVRRGQDEIASRTLSAAAPDVTLVAPNGGEALDGLFDVTWSASDRDGDALRFAVQYSADDGATWTALAVNLDAARLTVDASDLAGTDRGLMRVVATDGMRTAADGSDATFAVARKPPRALIHAPRDGAVIAAGAPLVLEGSGLDLEDGPLAGNSFSWGSDVDGALGAGQPRLVEGLSSGWHALSLRVADADGNHATDSISLLVGARVFLPRAWR